MNRRIIDGEHRETQGIPATAPKSCDGDSEDPGKANL